MVLVAAPGSEMAGGELVSPLATLPGIIGEPAADWRHALAGLDAFADVDVVIDHSGPARGAADLAAWPCPAST